MIKVALLFLAFALFLVAGCQTQQPAAPSAPTVAPSKPTSAPEQPTTAAQPTAAAKPSPASQPEPAAALKIGISVPLTGSTRMALNMERFSRMAIDDINAKGGIKVAGKPYRLEAITADDKFSADGGRDAANKLVLAEKVRFIIDSASNQTAAAQAVTEPNKVLLFASVAQDKSLGPRFPLTFMVGYTHTYMRVKVLFDWLAKAHPEVKTLAFVFNDDVSGHAIAEASEGLAKEKGIKVIAKEFYPIDIKDFSPLMTRALRDKPDALTTAAGGRPTQFLEIAKNLVDNEFKGPYFGISADETPLRKAATFADNFTVTSMVDWKAQVVSEREQEIIRRAMAKYGESEVDANQVIHYNVPVVLAEAIERAGTIDDTEKIAKTVREEQWDTIWTPKWGKSRFVGAKAFGLASVLEQPIYLTQVGKGQITTFDAQMGTMP